MKHKLKNINKNNAKFIEENITKEERITISQKPDENFVLVKLDLGCYKTSLSLDKLIDSFDYFRRKSDLKHFKRNENVVTLTKISKDSFKTLLNIAIDGKLTVFLVILL